MALPLTVPNHIRTLPTLGRPSFGLDSPSIAMSAPQSSCSLTILKGDPSHPINAHTPIHHKSDPSSSPTSPSQSRFAPSFSSHRPTAASTFDSSVHIHTISDHGILLPFLHRPSEVKELLFDTKANTSLAARLCSVFGGDPSDPLARGKDERWDEMLELLVELDRPLLDDEDWLARVESLVMERSPALWAQLKRCLGADGVTVKSGREKFDSWALQSEESPISTPSDASSDAGDESELLAVEVEPLDSLPQSFTERPAGQLHHSSLREASPTSLLSPQSEAGGSPGEVFAMSAGAEESAMTSSLEDILEEPATQAAASRPRSHSGKFAGLRISALTAGASPPVSRRASEMGGSPLPTGAMSPAGSPGTSFAKHRRLSTLMLNNQPATQQQPQGSDSKHNTDVDASLSPKSTTRRQRGVSEASSSHSSFQAATRRRAQSFARSFAELASPTEHLEQLRADHAKSEAERLADHARRISLAEPASAPAATEGGLGLHSGKARSKRVGSVSSKGSVSPPIPGLLPDGRTRHPSGSCGSRDLSESIAAFRATMGMSTSPSPSEKGSEGGDSATRKRKDVEEEGETAKPTSRTAESVDAKVSRKASPHETVFDKPKHMQQIESRSVGSAGSGLAVGGGFSLAKSGANFRRVSSDGPSWRSSFARSSVQQPAVHRRPGGFASLAQEYERTRQRRSSDMGGFSVTSNAVGSSEASSLETLGERSDVDRVVDTKGEDTPRAGAGPGGVTPRPIKVGGGYPFPNIEGEKLRSPSIVFPISPNPSVSRPQQLKKRLSSSQCQQAFARVTEVCGAHVSASIQELVTTAERGATPDEQLLEQVARRIGLVDHRAAGERGGREAEEADAVLAEEGYQGKWDAFAAVCRALGVGEYELGAAKARCGPAIDTCR